MEEERWTGGRVRVVEKRGVVVLALESWSRRIPGSAPAGMSAGRSCSPGQALLLLLVIPEHVLQSILRLQATIATTRAQRAAVPDTPASYVHYDVGSGISLVLDMGMT